MQDKIRDLTQGDLSSHLYRIALPIMGTSFVQIAYNITDMIWLGRLSSQALAAVGAASVFLWIAASFALINKIGSEVTISQGIGAGRRDEAKSYASQNVCMSLLLSVGMLAIYLLSQAISLSLCAHPERTSRGSELPLPLARRLPPASTSPPPSRVSTMLLAIAVRPSVSRSSGWRRICSLTHSSSSPSAGVCRVRHWLPS